MADGMMAPLFFSLLLVGLSVAHAHDHSLRFDEDDEAAAFSVEQQDVDPQFVRHRKGRWKEQHPQIRMNLFNNAYRMQCYSCMSPYLEDQFVFISHLYRKPLSFTDKCDRNNFDWQAVQPKNCSDLCVTLRMNDKVGGRRRNGYMRGCMSDIKFYNRSVLYYGDAMRGGGGSTHQTRCQLVRLRDLFAAPDWYGFDPNDHVELCTCHAPFCNSAHSPLGQSVWLVVAGLLGTTLMFDWIFPTRRKS